MSWSSRRGAKVILDAIHDFKGAGFNLFTCDGQDLIATNPADRFKAVINAGMAGYVRDGIAERLKAGRDRKKAEGKHYVGRLPYGFDKDLRPNPGEQAVIRRGFELRELGKNIRQITLTLNAEGLKPRTADKWHPDVVARTFEEIEMKTANLAARAAQSTSCGLQATMRGARCSAQKVSQVAIPRQETHENQKEQLCLGNPV
jgi:Resolvase, N terminal domain